MELIELIFNNYDYKYVIKYITAGIYWYELKFDLLALKFKLLNL